MGAGSVLGRLGVGVRVLSRLGIRVWTRAIPRPGAGVTLPTQYYIPDSLDIGVLESRGFTSDQTKQSRERGLIARYSTGCSSRGQFPTPTWNLSQPPITLALGYLMPSSGLLEYLNVYICAHNHNINLNLKNNK